MASEIKILVVDDDRYLLDLLLETLKTIGYDAVGACSAGEALDLLKTIDVQLVITDIKMPGMDGVEFAHRIKRAYPGLPVIFITGMFSPSVLQQADAEGFLTKPFRISQMEELIENVVAHVSGMPADAGAERILVVDDDDTFRMMLIETLKLSGYATAGATDSREAIDMLERGGIGTVIADFMMPGMDGISLAKYIKETWPGIPVVIITGYLPLRDDQMESARIADGFLMKPFRIESITELLENLKRQRTPPLA